MSPPTSHNPLVTPHQELGPRSPILLRCRHIPELFVQAFELGPGPGEMNGPMCEVAAFAWHMAAEGR